MNGAPDERTGALAAAAGLRVILLAMAGGVAMLAVFVLVTYRRGPAAPLDARAFATLRVFSLLDLLLSLSCWTTSAFLFKSLSAPRTPAAYQTASVARAALREGPALLGLIACFLGASSGALRVQPAYWANALPAAAFVGWVLASLPDESSVRQALEP